MTITKNTKGVGFVIVVKNLYLKSRLDERHEMLIRRGTPFAKSVALKELNFPQKEITQFLFF